MRLKLELFAIKGGTEWVNKKLSSQDIKLKRRFLQYYD